VGSYTGKYPARVVGGVSLMKRHAPGFGILDLGKIVQLMRGEWAREKESSSWGCFVFALNHLAHLDMQLEVFVGFLTSIDVHAVVRWAFQVGKALDFSRKHV
jgi:hypothetical protein